MDMIHSLRDEVEYLFSLQKQTIEPSVEIDLKSIISFDSAITHLEDICTIICLPTSIIQFRIDEKSNNWELMDSRFSTLMSRPSCSAIRKSGKFGLKLCYQCAIDHASLFHGMSSIDSPTLLQNRINDMKFIYTEKHHNPCYMPIINQVEERSYITYNCPIIGYRELVFPIYFENNVIAVLVACQMKLEQEINMIQQSKELFNENNSNFYYNTLSMAEDRIDMGINNNHVWDDNLSQQEYEMLVKTLNRWLCDFEKFLAYEMRKKREEYVNLIFNKTLTSFYEDIRKNTDLSKNNHMVFWNCVHSYIERIVRYCGLQYMAVYGAGSMGKKSVETLDLVAFYDNEDRCYTSVKKSISIDLLNQSVDRPTDSVQTPELGFAIDINDDITIAIYQPMKDVSSASILIIAGFFDSVQKSDINDLLLSGLINFSTVLSLQLTAFIENATQLQLQRTLRLYKHEISNLTASISHAIDYLGNPRLKEIPASKLQDVYKDALSTLSMFQFMSNNINILLDNTSIPKREYVSIYQGLIYKWENILRVDVSDKACDIVYMKSWTLIYTDIRYLELVIYNLLSNAVKYAYDGTKIYIHCSNKNDSDRQVLSVTNFSFAIPDNDLNLIFDFGYRTNEAILHFPEGSGIGLWIIRKVMGILGGEVRLSSLRVSDYNIPMMHALMSNGELLKNLEIQKLNEVQNEYLRLKNENCINIFGDTVDLISWVISEYHWKDPSSKKILAELYNPTYLISFEVIF